MNNQNSNEQEQSVITQEIANIVSPWEKILLTARRGLRFLWKSKTQAEEQIKKLAAKNEPKS